LDEEFTVDASASRDRPLDGGAITKYEWDFGDGTQKQCEVTAANICADTCCTTTHTYTEAGTFTIKLTVFDNEDPPNTGSMFLTVTVSKPSEEENKRPIASFTVIPPVGFAEVTEFVFNAGASRDPDGDDSKLKYSWKFGDGEIGAGVEVKHRYDEPKRYTVRLTVTDEGNASTEATQEIVVQDNAGNLPPRAFIATGRRTGTAPLTVTLDGRNSFDPNGDPLIFTWEFKENGGAIDTLIGAVVSRRFEQAGTFTVELEVSDGRGGVGLAGPETILVTPQGTPPPIDDEPGSTQPDDREPPDSARQRPSGGLCGFGMLGSLFASLLGLTAMMATRRHYR
jgi:PKD repeat protein